VEKEDIGNMSSDYDPVGVVKEKAMFLLKFAGLSKIHLKIEVQCAWFFTYCLMS